MNDSMAQAEGEAGPPALHVWQLWSGGLAAVLLAIAFVVAGIWKITDPVAAAERLTQAQIPNGISLPAALVLGIAETWAGVMLLVPRFRRWGAFLAGLLLVAFVVYTGAFYGVLRGQECKCFPWLGRPVGPGLFVGDGILLLLALIAGWWVRRPEGRRSAFVILGAVMVFALVSYGVVVVRQSLVIAPQSIVAGGKPLPLHEGRVFLYFFDPECLHCDLGARRLATLNWGGTTVVAVAVEQPQFGPEFLEETGLQAVLSTDAEGLRGVFRFTEVPYGVALEKGRQRAAFYDFGEKEPAATLKRLGFVR